MPLPSLNLPITMTDLTPLFHRCVDIVTNEFSGSNIQKPKTEGPPAYAVKDTFAKECSDFYTNLVQLSKFVHEIRPFYLQVNDEFSRLDRSGKKLLSVEDKNKIDEDFKYKIQQTYEKLKFLQTYENKRNEVLRSRDAGKGMFSSIFSTPDTDPAKLYEVTLASHRTQTLRFLNEATTKVNHAFESIERKRAKREKQLNLLHFQNINDDDFNAPHHTSQSSYQLEVIADEESNGSSGVQLNQEQIQELEQENKQLLNMKADQLKQVEKLHTSMVDIVKMQTELTLHLETQAEQIDSLLDSQDQVDSDLRLGNKTLMKATGRNKRGSNLIVTTCMVLAFLILILDYIV